MKSGTMYLVIAMASSCLDAPRSRPANDDERCRMVLTLLHWDKYTEVLAAACPRRPAPVLAETDAMNPFLPRGYQCEDTMFQLVEEKSVASEEPGLVVTVWDEGDEFRFQVYRVALNSPPSESCKGCYARAMFMDGQVEGVIRGEGGRWKLRPLNDQELATREQADGG